MTELGFPDAPRDGLDDSGSTPTSPGPLTRRELRAPARRRAAPVTAGPVVQPVRKRSRGRTAVNMSILTIAGGIIATMAIPAYAFTPSTESGHFAASATDRLKAVDAQTITVDAGTVEAAVSRDTPTATSQSELEAQAAARAAAEAAARAAAQRAAAEAAQAAKAVQARQQAATSLQTYADSYSGPSASDYVAKPVQSSTDLGGVFSVGRQYLGTPYIFGGATPAGFDCSGFIMFVYSQFGISLPHSVSGQAARGTRVSTADARPGDVVIMSGHDGIYAGNGQIMDAPKPGGVVSIRSIWTSDYYIVRITG